MSLLNVSACYFKITIRLWSVPVSGWWIYLSFSNSRENLYV
ncbi:hypothetical protein QE443_001423 [Pantoea ananatis]|nr:hypothetical protein [Pantoea ananatis]PWW18061.1 hypothetical protein DFO57_101348 [Pantoea sp. AG702]MDR6089774.1 hypothetical protein [Pantoea ananatis]PVY88156.1 hypothetical protein C7427_101616 [Pantoea ananatis]PWV67291.1 hypothetical protein C7425_103333 [Pantoea ananatis]